MPPTRALPQTPESERPSTFKRRRIDAAATLSKPFRSPLIKKPTPGFATPASPASPMPPPPSRTPSSAGTPSSTGTPTPASSSSSSSALKSSTVMQPPPTFKLPASTPPMVRRRPATAASPLNRTSPKMADPVLAAAQKRHTALLMSIREARAALESAKQAAALEASTEDLALLRDIKKWRGAAREAAEALYAVAGDRVNRQGGEVGRLLGNRSSWGDGGGDAGGGGGSSWGWDDAPRRDGEEGEEGVSDAEEERERLEEERRKKEEEQIKEEWGMGLMLKALGIQESMLGWDKYGECWKDMVDK